MSPLALSSKPAKRQIAALAFRHDLLRRLWPDQVYIDRLVSEAVDLTERGRQGDLDRVNAEKFLTVVFSLLRRPGELASICKALSKPEYGPRLLDRFIFSPVSNADLIAAMVSSPEVLATFPEGAWIGHALTIRASLLLDDNPDRLFEIEELVPVGIAADRGSARAILGSAFDERRLTEASANRLLELFPGDRYLTGAIEARKKESPLS